MEFMYATEKNYEICEKIVGIFHENNVSVAQACAILKRVEVKIAQDTIVGEAVKFDREVP